MISCIHFQSLQEISSLVRISTFSHSSQNYVSQRKLKYNDVIKNNIYHLLLHCSCGLFCAIGGGNENTERNSMCTFQSMTSHDYVVDESFFFFF